MAGSPKGVNNHKLTPKQRKFAQEYAINGGNATKAARLAGYDKSAKHQGAIGWELLHNPKVKAEIHRIQEDKICGNLASVAMGTLESIMGDPDAPAPARVRAATWVLESAGHGRQGATESGRDAEKEMEAMSPDQLRDHLDSLRAQIVAMDDAAKAKPVTVEVSQDNTQASAKAQQNRQ